jgi:hypothetical protein
MYPIGNPALAAPRTPPRSREATANCTNWTYRPMNLFKTVTLTLLLVLIGLVVYERGRTRELQATVDSYTKDRASLDRKLKDLSQLVAEAKEREATRASVVEIAPIQRALPPAPPPPPSQPPETSVPGVTTTAPAGWAKNGSKPGAYAVGVDRNQTLGGMPSAYVKSIEPAVDGFGGMMQTNSAEEFAGKRVRLSGWMKTEDANDGGGHLWLRVDGQQRGTPLQFDNMNNRAPKGTTDWQQYSVVLDVPADASALAYGFFVQGAGKMWVSGTKLEPVGPEVPSTNMLTTPIAQPPRNLPKAPVNLSFDPDQAK